MAEENIQEIPTAYLFGDIFIYCSTEKKSKCILKINDKKCGAMLNSTRPYNLKRHVERVHLEFAAKIIVNECNLNLSAKYVLNCCVEMLTINGRPFAFLSDSGFLKLINPCLDFIAKEAGKEFPFA